MAEHEGRRPAGYRADIQGLRAIAIVLVVVCHTGLALPGGFVGVDVFFVVSGFVIGTVLIRDLDAEGRVSLAAFYARRVRRILPSLAVLIVVGVIVGVFVLNPTWSQIVPFRTAGAAAVFVANHYLYRHVGYFDGAADGTNPFLHLWSLSVEEQLYVVLPLLFLVGLRLARGGSAVRRRRATAVVVGVVTIGSLLLSWSLTSGHSPFELEAPARAAFYGAPARVWEVGLGVLLAFGGVLVDRIPPAVASAAAIVGAVCIGGSALLLDAQHPYAGLAVAPAVVGSGLALVGGARSRVVGRALSWRPLGWVGDRSYSWYLWHWPMIVYARVLWPRSTGAVLAAAGGSLVVAAALYALFEDRVRRDRSIVGRRAVLVAFACIAVPLLVVFGAIRGAQGGWGVPAPEGLGASTPGWEAGCTLINRDSASVWNRRACTALPPDPERPAGSVLVLGDRYADSSTVGVLPGAAERNWTVYSWPRSGCPFTTAAPAGYPACETWQDVAMDLVDELDPTVVVIANRAPAYTTEVDEAVGSNAGRLQQLDGSRTRSADDAVDAWGAALREQVRQLRARGIGVVVVGAAPSYRERFPNPSLVRPDVSPPVRSRASVDAELEPLRAVERDALAGFDHVAYVDPTAVLCTQVCTPQHEGRWWYHDAFTLNAFGGARLAPQLSKAIDEVRPGGR